MSEKISVVGDINIDAVTAGIEKDLELKRDAQYFIDDLEYRRGGQGANFAVKCSELGTDVAFHGKVGDDRHGKFLKNHLKEKGVDPRLEMSEEVKTGTTLALQWDDAERFYLSHTENNSALSLEDVDLETLKNSEHLARRGVWFSEPMLKGGNHELLEEAKKNGVETSIDLHWDPHWSKDSGKAKKRKKLFLETLEHCDFLMCNEEELKKVTDAQNLEKAAEKVWSYGETFIVVHQGEEGSRIMKPQKDIKISTETVDNPENPTGTGDVYDAAFLHYWRNGSDLEEAGQRATEHAVRHLKGN